MKRITKALIIGLGCVVLLYLVGPALILALVLVVADLFPGSGKPVSIPTSAPPAQSVLKAGRLAPLPTDASEVKTHAWHGVFTGQSFLTFKASPDSIASWLKQSQALQGVPPAQEPYQKSKSAPQWFPVDGGNAKALYSIPAHKHHNWGHVIVDTSASTVYIHIVWS